MLEEVLEHQQQHTGQSLSLGVLYLHRNQEGDRERWFDLAMRLLKAYENADNPEAASDVTLLCLASAPTTDVERKLQRQAIALVGRFKPGLNFDPEADKGDWIQHSLAQALAIAEFRAGNLDECNQLLNKLEHASFEVYRAIALANKAVIAANEDKQWEASEFARQARHLATTVRKNESVFGRDLLDWNRPYLAELLLREAAQTQNKNELRNHPVQDH